uniref:hypothetical protein n=1 Tax=Mucilaginibacter sp. Bleaf8 TaxID=2834430 RepID=UPI001BD120EB
MFDNGSNGISIDYPKELFFEQASQQFRHYSTNEILNVFLKLKGDWFKDVYSPQKPGLSIFNLLNHFNKQILTEIKSEPYIHYQHLLKWRDVSYEIGEDVLTTSYFAYMDNRSGRKREYFAWRPVVFTTNNRLKAMLNKGLAENHFHLKGSAPVFDLAWISLMNNIQGRKKEFDRLKKSTRLTPIIQSSFEGQETDIEILVYKAAFIRRFLFEVINYISHTETAFKRTLSPPSNRIDSFELLVNLSRIQGDIASLKEIYGHKVEFRGSSVVPDYAITKNLHPYNYKGSAMLCGERLLLYKCFSLIYSANQGFEIGKELFYTYLLIKNALRKELLQLNGATGFGNFLRYQDRKELFIPSHSVYEEVFLNLAVSDTVKFQPIRSFETRLAPKFPASELQAQLSKVERTISKNIFKPLEIETPLPAINSVATTYNHFHTLHFIKKPDKSISGSMEGMIISRHAALRMEVAKQAKAITDLREGTSAFATKVRGIDAASSEFDARPEVFAQAFRFLKDHKLSGRRSWLKEDLEEVRLMATFHAGEDFYDIIDGIRTIDEAINFLNLNQGDRLGHALALGISAKEFYDFKLRKIILPKQVLLDNIAWLLGKVREFGISNHLEEIARLDSVYQSLFREIYSDGLDSSVFKNKHFPSSTYYDAWKLRGDDPKLYLEDLGQDIYGIINYTYWDRCRINYFFPLETAIRRSIDAKFLYQQYHYNPKVKEVGNQIKQFDISTEYIHLVEKVQNKYQRVISQKNIGIECNPTSNYLIGTFKRYAKHPIIRFNNNGLLTDPENLAVCPQLFVSINTDDQGIFSTSLENEYALLAIALEKEKDANGDPLYNPTMIYQWLDNIRQMGIEQSFNTI